MRLGISLLNLRPGTAGGIETYMRKLIEHAAACGEGDRVTFFVHRDNCDLLTDRVDSILVERPQALINAFRVLEAFTPWRDRKLEHLIRASGVDVMLYPQQSLYPLHNPVPTVLVVADVQYLFHPERYAWFDLQFRRRVYLTSLDLCSTIAAISRVSANHLVEQRRIAPDKVQVLHLGYDEPSGDDPPTASPYPRTFFYYPAASFPHKGHARLIHTFAELKRAGSIGQSLVFTGMQTPHWKNLARLIRDEQMEAHIDHLGYVSYATVKALYAAADAVLFPSEFEGFGIPVLEAAQQGKKLICSSLPVFDELGVPPEWQIDFTRADALLEALNRDGPTRLENKPDTWEEVSRKTYTLMRQAAGTDPDYSASS